jgi:hypothetical protein
LTRQNGIEENPRQEMARVLGVSAAERDGLARTVAAVLDRDQAAVASVRERLSGWTQRPCGAASARHHLDATPPEWAGFAHRNAELAARLAAVSAAVSTGRNEHDGPHSLSVIS